MGILSNAMTILGLHTFVQEICFRPDYCRWVVLSNIECNQKKIKKYNKERVSRWKNIFAVIHNSYHGFTLDQAL